MTPVFKFEVFGGLPVDAVAVIVPFAQWHEAANYEQYTSLPKKS